MSIDYQPTILMFDSTSCKQVPHKRCRQRTFWMNHKDKKTRMFGSQTSNKTLNYMKKNTKIPEHFLTKKGGDR